MATSIRPFCANRQALRSSVLLRTQSPAAPQQARAPPPPLGKPKLRFSGRIPGGRGQIRRSGGQQADSGAAAAAAAAAQLSSPTQLAARFVSCRAWAPAAAVGLSDGINTQKPSLMADSLEQHLPPPPIRYGETGGTRPATLHPQACAGRAISQCQQRYADTGRACPPASEPRFWQHACRHSTAAHTLFLGRFHPAARATPRSSRMAWSLCGAPRGWTWAS